MAACDACDDLVSAAASVEPHDDWVMESVQFRPDGELERRRCRRCDTKWERFTPDSGYGGTPPVWKRFLPGRHRVANGSFGSGQK
jgi:hypothetical protein